LAGGQLGRGDVLHRDSRLKGIQAKSWAQVARCHHVQPLHERGDLPRAEADARGVPEQQHRHLRSVCHSPTGYGLGQTFGTSAGTQDFDSVMAADVVVIIGANPTDGHPVFASRLKKRLRAGAKLIVIDPRRIDLVKSAHIEASHHLALRPGTNVAVMTALAHVIVTEKLYDEAFIRERCDWDEFEDYAEFVSDVRHSPEMTEMQTGVTAEELRAAARLYARRQWRDLLRAWRDGAFPRLHHRHGHRQPRHADRQCRARRGGCEPASRSEQRAGLLRHGDRSRTSCRAIAM
jgi:hypothetical protein